jgi:Peptide methionine sulfoxide reductase
MMESEIILGGGCFWCTEAVFSRVEGVLEVTPGYSGGSVDNPSYRAVCTGTTGHAEVVRLRFDENKISLNQILQIFSRSTIQRLLTGRVQMLVPSTVPR